MVEQLIRNQQVVGSSPIFSSILKVTERWLFFFTISALFYHKLHYLSRKPKTQQNSTENAHLNVILLILLFYCDIILLLFDLKSDVMEKYISNSPKETENIASSLAKTLTGGEVIAFRGGLGMGKTCFTRGLAKGLCYNGDVTSPTFALINEYLGGRLNLYHFDMYRISTWEELYSSGFFEYIEEKGVVAAEWSENIENALPENTIYVEIKDLDQDKREILIYKKGEENETSQR